MQYVLSFNGLGKVKLYKVEKSKLDEFLENLEADGEMFVVVTNPIQNDILSLQAELV